jgi:hypothetical protein
MKSVLTLFFPLLLCSAICYGQEQGSQDRYYTWHKDMRLTYDDFKLVKKLKAEVADTGKGSKMEVTYVNGEGKEIDTVVDNLDFFVRTGYQFGFKNMFGEQSDTGAASSVTILSSYYRVGDQVFYKICSVFYPNLSFLRMKTQEVLDHEQIHFDVCEVFARKLRKYFMEKLNKANYDNIGATIENNRLESLLMQAQFDKEQKAGYLKHGNNKSSNAAWRKKIDTQLEALKAYASPESSLIDGTVLL